VRFLQLVVRASAPSPLPVQNVRLLRKPVRSPDRYASQNCKSPCGQRPRCCARRFRWRIAPTPSILPRKAAHQSYVYAELELSLETRKDLKKNQAVVKSSANGPGRHFFELVIKVGFAPLGPRAKIAYLPNDSLLLIQKSVTRHHVAIECRPSSTSSRASVVLGNKFTIAPSR